MRNKTFLRESNQYSVPIKRDKLKYYAYIDYFKEEFRDTMPFYLRNFDIFYNSEFTERDWNYFVKRISSKLEGKEPKNLIKTEKIQQFETWVANL